MKRSALLGCPLLLALLGLSGCGDAEVTAYRAAKDAEPSLAATAEHPAAEATSPAAAAARSGMNDVTVSTAAGQPLIWSAPAEWQAKAPTAMRKGSYTVPAANGETAELSITAFPGAVGGELANLNRWRGQLSLAPVDDGGLDAAVTRFESAGLTFTVVDCASAEAAPRRILGAMTPHDGAMWFFKLTGPDATVRAAKPAFLAFLKTVKTAPAPTP